MNVMMFVMIFLNFEKAFFTVEKALFCVKKRFFFGHFSMVLEETISVLITRVHTCLRHGGLACNPVA